MKPMNEMNSEVMITCAVTGGGDTVGKHPAIPVTPEQIANAAIEAAKAGAAIAHCHVRDPETGKNCMRKDLFAEVAERVRSSSTDVILNLTGGNGGHYIPSAADPRVADPASDICTPEERAAHAVEIKPEICSFDVGAVMFGSQGVYIGTVDYMREIAKMLKAAGVKPEIEAFDTSGIMVARQLIEEGHIDAPAMFQLCLGIGNNAPTNTSMMLAMRDLLPENSHWWSFGISRMQMPMAAKAVLLGGNVRVGLEDNLYLSRGVFANNGQLVEKAANIVGGMGCRVLTPAEARVKLGLPAQ
jgi:uncharacterized protein (DUF849 family)